MFEINRSKLYGVALLLAAALLACSRSYHAPEGMRLMSVEKRPLVSELFFSGMVAPIKSSVVVSPIEGVVEEKYFEYGQFVKKDQALFKIHSSQLEKEYREAITSYLKTKSQYYINKAKLNDDEALQKEGIISRNDYQNSQNTASDSYVAFLQADQSLKQVLEKTHGKWEEAQALKLEDREAVTKALLNKVDTLTLSANAEGVALMPDKSAGEEGGASKLLLGSQVKSGQVVAVLGDLSGLSVAVSINQVDVNRVKVGQKAFVSSDGFPGLVLQGEVVEVGAQGIASSTNVTTFPVKIEVKNLSDKAREKIAVGMTAMVKVVVEQAPAILIPIKAVEMKNGMAFVRKLDSKHKKLLSVPVMTGKTTLGEVEVLQGLSEGERLLVPN